MCIHLHLSLKPSIKNNPSLIHPNNTKHYHHHLLLPLLLAMPRNLEERSSAVNGSPSRNSTSGNTTRAVSRSMVTAGKGSPPSPDKVDKKITSSESRKHEKLNGSSTRHDHNNHFNSAPVRSEQEVGVVEKVNAEVIEWPKIIVALSRKEKEDDFLAMKGTKLPHRPKKRAKNIERALQVP